MIHRLIALSALVALLCGGEVAWAWTGGVGHDRAVIVASVDGPVAFRVVGDRADTAAPSLPMAPDADGLGRVVAAGLQPGTRYLWGVAGAARPSGVFATLPRAGEPASFRIAFGACAKEADVPVFAAIARQQPLFFLCTGDLHYGDVAVDDAPRIRQLVVSRPSAAAWRALTAATPFIYMWDDHDFGGNNSGWGSPATAAVHAVYRQVVPHHPLALDGPQAPIAQAWSVGRVRFVMPDLRTERDRMPGSLLGETQRGWIAGEIAAASARHRLLVLVSSVPWIGAAMPGKDRWQSYADERAWLAGLIKAAGIRACVLSGDAHMVAIDDGRNSDHAGGWPIPVFQAAALHQAGSYKGGPYSHGAAPGGGQFGIMRVDDDGAVLSVGWEARDGNDGIGDGLISARRDVPEGTAPAITYRFTVP